MANLKADAKGPFLKRAEDGGMNTNKIMIDVMIALVAVFIFAFWKNGIKPYLQYDAYVEWYKTANKGAMPAIPGKVYILLQPILTMLTALLVAVLTEAVFFKVTKKVSTFVEGVVYAVTKSYALIPPMILVLMIPVNAPIFTIVFTTVLMTLVGKMLFGGFGHNIFNPAAIGAAIFAALYGGMMSEYNGWFDYTTKDFIVSGGTALANAQNFSWAGSYYQLVGKFGSLLDFFLGMVPGSLGETSALLILIAGIYLVIRKAITWEVPVVYVGTIFVITWIYGITQGVTGPVLGVWYPAFHILSGGILFGAVFMFTEPVTSPVSTRGRVIYAFIGAILTVLFRLAAGTPGGVATAIVTMNLFTTIIDQRAAIIQAGRSIKKRVASAVLCAVLALGVFGFLVFKNPNANEALASYVSTNSGEVLLLATPTKDNNGTTYSIRVKGYKQFDLEIRVNKGQINQDITVVDAANVETSGYGRELLNSKTFRTMVREAINKKNYSSIDVDGLQRGLGFYAPSKEFVSGATKGGYLSGSALVHGAITAVAWETGVTKLPPVYVAPSTGITDAVMTAISEQLGAVTLGNIVKGTYEYEGATYYIAKGKWAIPGPGFDAEAYFTVAIDAEGKIAGIKDEDAHGADQYEGLGKEAIAKYIGFGESDIDAIVSGTTSKYTDPQFKAFLKEAYAAKTTRGNN